MDQVIFLDVSTSMTLLAGLLNKEVTVYSHSLDNAIQLSSHSQVDFHLLGGKFYPKNRFYYDANQAQILDNLRFDLAFFGASSLANGEVTFEDAEDVAVKSLVFERSSYQGAGGRKHQVLTKMPTTISLISSNLTIGLPTKNQARKS